MTDYNERLDKALAVFANYDDSYEPGYEEGVIKRITEAKQAITSLIKELVAEAKPANAYKTSDGQVPKSFEAPAHAYDVAIQDFEQNLLKALEEK